MCVTTATNVVISVWQFSVVSAVSVTATTAAPAAASAVVALAAEEVSPVVDSGLQHPAQDAHFMGRGWFSCMC